MKTHLRIWIGLIGSLTAICYGCVKNEITVKPEIRLITTPGPSGLTTDYFTFDARQTVNPTGGGNLFFRWNFGEGSSWDSQLSKESLKTKRFMKPGHYVVTLYAVNSRGFEDTTFYDVTIGLGKSAPRPVIRMVPDTGNFLTRFMFDARLTRDDEDSLSTLKFKWDFNGDGFYDTPYDTATVAYHVFGAEGQFKPIVEVIDPTGIRATAFASVVVNDIDPEIIPDFSWFPANGAVGDTILFDASKSRHLTNGAPVFTYSWRLEEGDGWTPPSDIPTISHSFRTSSEQKVLLKVMDDRGLVNQTQKPIHLDPENYPPNATFDISVPYGNIKTQFELNAWNCSDDHDTIGKLLIRWDFDGDRIWDTGYSTEKVLFHQYASAGFFNLTLEARDSKGLTSQYSRKVLVSPWENETGILIDKRDMQRYGTVKIGNRWWMAENLKYDYHEYDQHTDLAPKYIMFPSLPLNEDRSKVETYGRFYFVEDAIHHRSLSGDNPYIRPLCPRGWSIPTKEEWEQLIADTHADQNPENLMLSGNSDFNGTYMGYIDYVFIYKGLSVVDTVFTFRDTFKKAVYFSTTRPADINRADLFMVKVDRNGPQLWTGWDKPSIYAPVRGIKDE